MRWAQTSNVGLVRALNEDSLCISPKVGLFAVADGMGGHRAGEVASSVALRILERELGSRLAGGAPPEKALVDCVQEANRYIFEMSGHNPEWAGMGTTITACLKREQELFVAQVGDSRASDRGSLAGAGTGEKRRYYRGAGFYTPAAQCPDQGTGNRTVT